MRNLLLQLLIFILTTSVSFAKDVNLKWKQISAANSYFIQVSLDETFDTVVVAQKVKSNSLKQDLQSGIYYLRVQALDEKERPSKWSKPFKLVVTAPVKPMPTNENSEDVAFQEKAPAIKTDWETDEEKAPKYLVKVIRNGKEIESKQTTEPTTDFKPTEPGEYKVTVSSSYEQYYGPPVVVKKVNIHMSTYAPIKMDPTKTSVFKSKKPVEMTWEPVKGAKKYSITLYKIDDRSPAGEKIAVMTKEVTGNNADFGKLPPGKYVASVDSSNGSTNSTMPVSEYQFDVKRSKPVEFEKIDLMFKYTVKSANYSNTIVEAGKSASTSTVGGELSFEGSMWFPDSNFGMRADGSWGNLLMDNMLITSNELKFMGMYRFAILREHFKTELRPLLGIRAWTIPIVVKDMNTSNSTLNTQVLAPTFGGPVAGFDIHHPFTEKWAAVLRAQASLPIAHTSLTNQGLKEPLLPTLNTKAEIGVKHAWKENYRLVAMAGYQLDQFAYNTTQGNSGTTVASSKSQAKIESITGTLGI